ncbi:hypothetical protein PGTUg99_029195 [Puccinia graminis f. sp. tritici]|nr:hypothetical protein PGTUg99_029195 [Puccinia graminis f. sp. tritici]
MHRDNPPAITFLIESRQELHLLLTSYRTAPPSPVQPLILVDLAENSSILGNPPPPPWEDPDRLTCIGRDITRDLAKFWAKATPKFIAR